VSNSVEDELSQTVVNQYRDIGEIFDDAIILAGAVALVDSTVIEIADQFGGQEEALNKRINDHSDVRVVFSGNGFTPSRDPEGEAVTVFRHIKSQKGILGRVFLSDTSEMEYVDPDDIYAPEDDEPPPSGDTALYENELEKLANFKKDLLKVPDGVRLFVQFILHEELDADLPIHGVSIRANSYTVYSMIDATSLHIESIEAEKTRNPLEPGFLRDFIRSVSNNYRKQIQNKSFRNRSLDTQKNTMEEDIKWVNSVAGIDRFMVGSSVENIFIPNTAGETRNFDQFITNDHFVADCIRIDCMELQTTAEGLPIRKRRGNVNSYVSMCLIVEIDDKTRDRLGCNSNILWIPFTGQLQDLIFLEKNKLL